MFFKRWMLFILFTLLTISGCGTASLDEKSALQTENVKTATITRIVDGDTMKISLNGKKETVRLLLVDTPETKHPDLPLQPFCEKATKFAKKILTDKKVKIEFDGPLRDKYDRLLGYIWIDDQNFNQVLLENGFARYAYEYDPPYAHQKEMKQAEQEAKKAGTGIWSIDDYVQIDGFNHKVVEKDDADTSNKDVYYENCTEARTADATPLYEGDSGYGTHMDGDLDGIACE